MKCAATGMLATALWLIAAPLLAAPRAALDADEQWTRPLPDFPEALRHRQPVADLREAIVYTINETILTEDGIDLARKAGSDVLVRGWFKWGTAPDFQPLAPLISQAQALGALFGGGITCSALYHGESGLSEKQLMDMATRGPAGQLKTPFRQVTSILEAGGDGLP